MKKSYSFLIMALAIAMFVLTSCNKEKNKEESPAVTDLTEYVVGLYDGELTYSVSGTPFDTTDCQVRLTKEGDNTVSVVLPSVGEGMFGIPEITLSGVVINTTDNVVFNIEETEINTTIGTTNYVGQLEGVVNGSKLTLDYSLTPGAMPMSIDFIFVGEK